MGMTVVIHDNRQPTVCTANCQAERQLNYVYIPVHIIQRKRRCQRQHKGATPFAFKTVATTRAGFLMGDGWSEKAEKTSVTTRECAYKAKGWSFVPQTAASYERLGVHCRI